MKPLLIIPFITLSLLSSLSVDSEQISRYTYSNDFDYVYAPPTSGGLIEIEFDASFSTKARLGRKVEVVLYRKNTETSEVLFSNSFSTTISENLKLSCATNWDNIQINLIIYQNLMNDKVATVKNHEFFLRRTQSSINLSNCSGLNALTDARIYQYKNGIERYISESYQFGNVSFNYIPFNDSLFKFSDMFFDYKYDGVNKEISYKKATLYIDNQDHVFDDVRNEGITGLGCEIDLDINLIDEKYYLAYKNDVFVNPNTLKMSNKANDGYIKTGGFYFPINYFNLHTSALIILTIYYAGVSNVSISIPIEITPSKHYYGSCYDSDYCIGTSQSTPDYELGETIIHS